MFRKNNKEQVLKTAKSRISALFSAQFLQIARELDDFDPYQYARAFSAGLQEFIEAYTYHKYLSNEQITDYDDLQNMLLYEKSTDIDQNNAENLNEQDTETLINQLEIEPTDKPVENALVETNGKTYKCLVQPIEFMLGVGDLSGEVMRHCINSLNSGDLEECFQARRFMQFLYTGQVLSYYMQNLFLFHFFFFNADLWD